MNREEYTKLLSAYKFRVEGAGYLSKLVDTIHDNIEEFQILKPTDADAHFPAFLKEKLERYYNFFERTLKPIISSVPVTDVNGSLDNHAGTIIKNLSIALEESINLYYLGDTHGAFSTLKNVLDILFIGNNGKFEDLFPIWPTRPGMDFFRARIPDGRPRTKEELFHIPFEKRHFASTNRYSIPGVPALYVSTDPYTCYTELDQPDVRTLNFSLLKNNSVINILYLERIEDALHNILKYNAAAIENPYTGGRTHAAIHIIECLQIFPLIIACTVKVLNSKATFKPEYIIPQLLLQYLRGNNKIDGIMYPSSKVHYEKGYGFESIYYNYVFPVKSSLESGYCPELSKQFSITEPTSLEMEGVDNMPQSNLLMELYQVVNALDAKPLLPVT